MTPLSDTVTPSAAAVAAASAESGLLNCTPLLASHSVAVLATGVEPGTERLGPTNFCRARNTPPSRLLSVGSLR